MDKFDEKLFALAAIKHESFDRILILTAEEKLALSGLDVLRELIGEHADKALFIRKREELEELLEDRAK